MSDQFLDEDLKLNKMINVEIELEDKAWRVEEDFETIINNAVKLVLNYFKLQESFFIIEVYVRLTSDSEIEKLNNQYRGKNKPTNVLSFPGEDFNIKNFKKTKNNNEFLHLGDIIMAYQVIKQEANDQLKSFNDHLTHLVVHSMLHLLGYDHESEKEAAEMEDLEIKILSIIGIKSPYEY